IAIIGLLSTLAVVALNSARQKSRDSKRVADIKQIQTALELYFADQNGYPVEAVAINLGEAGQMALCSTGWEDGCGATTTYMGLVPDGPLPADSCVDEDYVYTAATSSSYTLNFCLGGVVGDLVAGNHTADPNGLQ
ncbi:hypothetical protein KKE28_04620, partial [Patescibacteria group bacterium]|nr:hypothetical protein [Patescibacteria group bacterium]